MRPTPEQIAEARESAREFIEDNTNAIDRDELLVLLAATEPPTDEEIYATAEMLWNDAAAENKPDFNEGVRDGIIHILGPVKP